MKIIIATLRQHNINNFYKIKELYKTYTFYLITKKDDLTLEKITKINPDYIFFPHWSFYIPQEIYNNYQCIIFHLGNLPFGRGGSPLQNLIIRGVYKSKICALKACDTLDGGEIYLKHNISFKISNAQRIYEKISKIIFFKLIPRILHTKINPRIQKGKVVIFKRRTKEQSNINTLENPNLIKIYDFIRMLDAIDYPKAFLEFENIKMVFQNAKKHNNKIKAEVIFYEK
ncbi:methionyl-tRNA formyltransferase [Campylobacter lari]|uniref:methionyl-tRNA formyltransferase n=1 Tax=Campylobacter TaxID=194 RepID=UPI001274D426|nr:MULTISPECIES: methionyl-tRNA formyltransferase [Campylobacter]MCR8683415.1 methionyl-tRNA formyltransferase [Campylobacter sp. LMG 17559]EAH7188026.1 methionyl-tRNA formyltransferase [Campylobacter lari]EAI4828565.1 methionyl-tRNA formyltransferase [Campylobacter lari]EAJ1119475.1 methionyl-tRNA formyltransferase [Campylobacter lari]EAK0437932.1 methionyl-tRNA formyltransferase [Campylobacter lari]